MERLHFIVTIKVVLILTTFSLVTAELSTTLNRKEGSVVPRLTIDPVSIRARLGSTIHSACEGYFGRLNNETTAVDWAPRNMETNQYLHEENNERRFNITVYQRNGGEFKGSTLTVINVTKGDYNITMVCILSSARLDSTILRNFTIRPYIEVVRDDVGRIVVPVLAAFVVVVLLLSVLSYYCWGPQISLCLYSRCARPSSTENFRYDTIVIHDNEDNEFVLKQIRPYLEGLPHIRVEFLGGGLPFGAPLFAGTQDLIRESFCIMFVITQNVKPVLYGHLLKAAKELRRKIVVIKAHPEGLNLSRWNKQNPSSLDLRELEKQYLRYLLTITWPGDEASDRRRKNFWCRVSRQLPLSPRACTEL